MRSVFTSSLCEAEELVNMPLLGRRGGRSEFGEVSLLLLTSAWRQADVSMTSRRPRMRGTRRPQRLPQLVGPVWEESCCWEQVFPQTDFMAQF